MVPLDRKEGVQMNKLYPAQRMIIIFLCVIMISGCSNSKDEYDGMGNTGANIINGGFSVRSDESIYFMNYADNNNFYSINTDGTGEKLINEDAPMYLNLYDGWLYYCNGKDDNKIYKIKPDGSDRTLLSETSAVNLIIKDDWIYYIDTTPGNDSGYNRLFRMNIGGNDKQMLNERKVYIFNVDNNYLYFSDQDEQYIYRTSLEGGSEERLGDSKASYLAVAGDFIYYLDPTDYANTIWRMKKDGTDNERLSEDKASCINPSGEWIYYGNTPKDSMDLQLKRIKVDGSSPELINEDDPVVINIHGDKMLYVGINFMDFSLKQTMASTDGSLRKDFNMNNKAPVQNAPIYSMGQMAVVGDMEISVEDVYATNVIKSTDPDFQSQIYDEISSGMYVFADLIIRNNTDNDIDIINRIGLMTGSAEQGYSIYHSMIGNLEEKDIKESEMTILDSMEFSSDSFILPKGKNIAIQTKYEINRMDFPLLLGIYDESGINLIAAFEIAPLDEFFVETWESSYLKMTELFPDYEVTQSDGIPFRFDGDEEEMMYYRFEVKKTPDSAVEFYFMKRDTGEIYLGEYDENFSDYPAVPKTKLE